MRGLYRVLGYGLAAQLPELVALCGREELARRFAAEFRLDEMAAALPGRVYVAAPVSDRPRRLRFRLTRPFSAA
jgi:hypothetical protein